MFFFGTTFNGTSRNCNYVPGDEYPIQVVDYGAFSTAVSHVASVLDAAERENISVTEAEMRAVGTFRRILGLPGISSAADRSIHRDIYWGVDREEKDPLDVLLGQMAALPQIYAAWRCQALPACALDPTETPPKNWQPHAYGHTADICSTTTDTPVTAPNPAPMSNFPSADPEVELGTIAVEHCTA